MDKVCFVISPIGEEGSEERKRSDQVFNFLIKPACEQFGYIVERVDMVKDTDIITSTILERLKTANIVIADMTDKNPNVFYELGYRCALEKPVIQLLLYDQQLPFDISSVRTIKYDHKNLDSVDTAKKSLIETIKTIEEKLSATATNNESISEYDGKNTQTVNFILDKLVSIENSLDNIGEKLQDNNAETIRNIITAMQSMQPSASPEERAMQTFVETIIKNPQKLPELMKSFDNASKYMFPNKK